MSDDFVVYFISALIVIVSSLAGFCLIVAEVRLLMWLFGM